MSKKRKDSSINARIVCALVASMVSIGVVAAPSHAKAPAPRPTLVVGIFVEGLTAEYVDLLRSNFGEDGFNRLLEQGVTVRNVDYGPGIDATAATAMLVSGAAPACLPCAGLQITLPMGLWFWQERRCAVSFRVGHDYQEGVSCAP